MREFAKKRFNAEYRGARLPNPQWPVRIVLGEIPSPPAPPAQAQRKQGFPLRGSLKPLEPRRVGVGLTPRPEGLRADAEAAGRKGPPGTLGAEAEAHKPHKPHKPSFRLLRFKVESAPEAGPDRLLQAMRVFQQGDGAAFNALYAAMWPACYAPSAFQASQ